MIQLKALTFAVLALAGLSQAGPTPRWCQRDVMELLPRHSCPATTSTPKRWDCPVTGGQCVNCHVTSTIYTSPDPSIPVSVYDGNNNDCVAGLLGSIVDPFKYQNAGWEYTATGGPQYFDLPPSNRSLTAEANFDGVERQDPTAIFLSEIHCQNGAYATITCGTCCPWYPQAGAGHTETPPPKRAITTSEDDAEKTDSRDIVVEAENIERDLVVAEERQGPTPTPVIFYNQDCQHCTVSATKDPNAQPLGDVPYDLLKKCFDGGIGKLIDNFRGAPRYATWYANPPSSVYYQRDSRGWQQVYGPDVHIIGTDTQITPRSSDGFISSYQCGDDVGKAIVTIGCGFSCQNRS